MAGPYGTAVLDDFNRTDAGTLGANWTADISAQSFSSWSIVSNTCDATAGGFDSNWWNVAQYGPDCEVYCTIPTLPITQELRLLARIANPGGATVTGYEVEVAVGGADILVYRRNSDVSRTLIDTVGVAVAATDKLALACIGSEIEVWKDSGSGWVKISFNTDSTYSNAGFLGIWNQNNTTLAIDDFGGGSISPSAGPWDDPPIGMGGRGAG